MKQNKIPTKAVVIAICVLSVTAFAQKPKIAVYVSQHNGYSQEEASVLKSATVNTLVRSGKYQVVERSNVIDEELSKQASGSVDDDELTVFGRQAGAQYITVSDMTFLGRTSRQFTKNVCNQSGQCYPVTETVYYQNYQVSSRIIDVETAEILAMSITTRDIQNGAAMTKAIGDVVTTMLENVSSVKSANLPKTAVYVQGISGDRNSGRALYTYTLGALFMRSKSNGNFRLVERSDAFTGQIDRELGKQHSGSVDDSQIMRMGKQFGIQQIVIAGIEIAMDNFNISARIVNVESAAIERASEMYQTDKMLTTRRIVKRDGLFLGGNYGVELNVGAGIVEDMIPMKGIPQLVIPAGTSKTKTNKLTAEYQRDVIRQISAMP